MRISPASEVLRNASVSSVPAREHDGRQAEPVHVKGAPVLVQLHVANALGSHSGSTCTQNVSANTCAAKAFAYSVHVVVCM